MKKLHAGIYTLAFGGEGVGRVDGKVCFVAGALPGETVIFTPTKEDPKFMRGELVEIVKRSPDRIEPVCKHYGRCGGCRLQHITYEKELYYKKEQAADLLKRIAKISEPAVGALTAAPDPYRYRSTVTLHKGACGYGFFTENGKGIVEIDECPVAEDAINGYLGRLPQGLSKDKIILKSDGRGNVWSTAGEGQRFFQDTYRGREITVSPLAFTQCNRFISTKIAEKLEEWMRGIASGAVLFDLYCGVGFFSFMIDLPFSARIGMDAERISIDCAKDTVKRASLEGYKFYVGDAEKDFFACVERNKKEKNVVLIDPPRKGAGKDFFGKLAAMDGLSAIYYLSCDPARLARDIVILTGGGAWRLERIELFDMFPRTAHIEALAEFRKK